MKKLALLLSVLMSSPMMAQETSVNTQALDSLYNVFRTKEINDSLRAKELESNGSVKVLQIDEENGVTALVGFEKNGFPIFVSTDNTNAANTIGTNLVVAGAANGYGLTGGGILIGEWDGGRARSSHYEFNGRVSQGDLANGYNDHATHVAGTMVAAGLLPSAKGMAPSANVLAHDFNSDNSEMTTFASGGNIISNHSYGAVTGWRSFFGLWMWYGDTTVSTTEDYRFGFYSWSTRSWDLIANAAPYYLIVKSAGNDRGEGPTTPTNHQVWDNSTGGWVISNTVRPADGGTSGFDCISTWGVAKNILTVGAVNDIAAGYNQPSDVVMSSFSGWGPTDDGRIKPDIVANGVTLLSTGSGHDSAYYWSSGTSMSAPSVTGSAALLQEMYHDSNNAYMRASTLKALIIHSAHEAGANPGPDYSNGWGLMNTKGAADIIADTSISKIIEDSLTNNGTKTYTFYTNGLTDVSATIVWNDPAATPVSASLDPTNTMLVNDLDLRVSNATGTTKLPWTLNPASPSSAATQADNFRDNVEKVLFTSPSAGVITITVDHKSTLTGGGQSFSLIVTGVTPAPATSTLAADFVGTPDSICTNSSVQFTSTSTGMPTGYEWTFTGGTPSTSTASNPVVTYNTSGTYAVKLKVTNASGSDSLTQTNYIHVTNTPVVTTPTLANTCISNSTFTLTGATPAGGTWSGTGVVNGTSFDPSTAGAGTHTLTYSYSNGSCTVSQTTTITVGTMPSVSMSNLSPVCESNSAFTLSNGSPAGGTYSGPGVSGTTFTPAVAGVGSHVLTYTYTSGNGCVASATTGQPVLQNMQSTLSSFANICEGASNLTLTGGSPSGGTYSGTGVTNGVFNPATAGAGTHTITYVSGMSMCALPATQTITVLPSPTVNLGSFAPVCSNASATTLTGGTPTGGVYSGTGVTSGSFSPAAAGNGTHVITYTYTNASGCSNTATSNQVVNQSITSSLPAIANQCDNNNPLTLTGGSPAGGTYSGTGVNGNIFNPATAGSGSHTITYTAGTGSCVTPATQTVVVNSAPNVTAPVLASLCDNASPLTLTGGIPAGGDYTGTGVTNNIFDPASAGVGTHTLTYLYTDANGCSNSDVTSQTVNASSTSTLTAPTAMCVDASPVTLTGGPTGGTFSGNGVDSLTGVFNPATAGPGTHTITYTSSTGVCVTPDSKTIQVNALPNVTLGTQPDVCSSDNAIFLSGGSPAGGMFSGNNVNMGVFNASNAGNGLHTIIYTVTDSNGCVNVDSNTIKVVNSIVYQLADTLICTDGSAITLQSGTPFGGIYSGPGVTGNQFDPSTAGVGTHTITYSNPQSSCAVGDSAVFTVQYTPTVALAPQADVCISNGLVALTGGTPLGGVYSGPGVSNNMLDPTIAGAGVSQITYTFTSNGCAGNDMEPIVIDSGNPTIVNAIERMCEGDTAIVLVGTPAGGVFSGTGVMGTTFDPSFSGSGTHTITYTITNGCAGSDQATIVVNPSPVIASINGPNVSTQNAIATYNVPNQGGSSFTWNLFGGNMLSHTNNQIQVNWGNGTFGEITAIETDNNGCMDSTQMTVSLWPLSVEEQELVTVSYYPNPAVQFIKFDIDAPSSEEVELIITNTNGQMVHYSTQFVSSGNNHLEIPVSMWSAGGYFFQIKTMNEIISSGQFVKR